jgi:hypothetical protein
MVDQGIVKIQNPSRQRNQERKSEAYWLVISGARKIPTFFEKLCVKLELALIGTATIMIILAG